MIKELQRALNRMLIESKMSSDFKKAAKRIPNKVLDFHDFQPILPPWHFIKLKK